MSKQLLLMCVLAIAAISLPLFAEEKISYTIAITIPKVIEHSQLPQPQAAQDNENKKAEEEKNQESPLFSFPEPVVIVKTLMQQL